MKRMRVKVRPEVKNLKCQRINEAEDSMLAEKKTELSRVKLCLVPPGISFFLSCCYRVSFLPHFTAGVELIPFAI